MSVETTYKGSARELVCLSTDSKPDPNCASGLAVLRETDTQKRYRWNGSAWVEGDQDILSHVGFPGGTANFLRADGTFAAPPGGSIPAGIICMWSGLLSAIPSGWNLCDGTAGTPDLRDRFIVGAAAGANPGATGGSTTHTHTGHSAHVFTQPSGHSAHVFTQPTISWPVGVPTNAAHTHDNHTITTKFTTSGSGTAADTAPVTHSSIAPAISWPAGVPTNASGAVDVHSAHSGGAVDAHSGHDSPDHRPLFYALAYIQKS